MDKKQIEVISRGVCVRSGMLLLCHTRGCGNTYLPGGHVDFGEKAKDALVREVEEELGVRASVGRFLGAVEHAYRRRGELQHEVNLVFQMTCRGLNPRRGPESLEDYIEFLWVPVRSLQRSRLEPAPLRKLIPGWLARRGAGGCWSGTL